MRRIEADRPTTDEWYVRVSMGFFSGSLWPRSGRCGPRCAVLVLVAGWAFERMLFVPAGRGSESYRFVDSVDAQTCCPFMAFNLTYRGCGQSPGLSNPRRSAARGDTARMVSDGAAEGHPVTLDSRVITEPHPRRCCRNVQLLQDSGLQTLPGATFWRAHCAEPAPRMGRDRTSTLEA